PAKRAAETRSRGRGHRRGGGQGRRAAGRTRATDRPGQFPCPGGERPGARERAHRRPVREATAARRPRERERRPVVVHRRTHSFPEPHRGPAKRHGVARPLLRGGRRVHAASSRAGTRDRWAWAGPDAALNVPIRAYFFTLTWNPA